MDSDDGFILPVSVICIYRDSGVKYQYIQIRGCPSGSPNRSSAPVYEAFMFPYFNNKKLSWMPRHDDKGLEVTCGRCEGLFNVFLRKRKDFPTFLCPKCKVENRLNKVWK